MLKTFFLIAAIASFGLVGCATSNSGGKWTVLFDGKTPQGLRGYKQQTFPTNNWIVQDGALKTVPGRAVDLITSEKYESFDLEFEWKVAPGGNSGVMYRVAETSGPTWHTGPEYQLLDDARHGDGKNPKTSAGSLYAMIAPNASKKVNPAGEWNKTRIIMKDNHVEHWLNGAMVVQYQWGSGEVAKLIEESKFKGMPRFMKESTGHIAFQHHGEEAWIRNIRIRRL